MINVYNFERLLKIKWLKWIISSQKHDWQTLLNHEIKDEKKATLCYGSLDAVV